MNKMNTVKLFTLMIALIFIISACGTKSNNAGNSPASSAPASSGSSEPAPSQSAAAGTTELEIPLIAPFSGSVAFYGEGYTRGLNLAFKKNNHVINGVKVSIKPYDDKCTPDEAMNQTLKIISDAVITIGPACTANTLAVQPKLMEAKIPHIALNYGSVAYTKGDEFIFAATPNDKDLATAITAFGLEQNIKKWALISATDAYSASGAKMFAEIVKGNSGLELVDEVTFNGGNREFKGLLLNLEKSNPDAIYVIGYEADAGTLIKQARQIGIKAPFYGAAVFTNKEFLDAAGDAANDAHYVSVISPDDPFGPVQEYVKAFQAEYGVLPNDVSTSGYTAGLIITQMLEKIGTNITKESVAAALKEMKLDNTPYGNLSYNEDGSFKTGGLVVIGQIKDGKPAVIKRQ
jgi:branched-chain amino acid transport system substrate-binding protein